jgi:phosphatidylglycerol lysyltransferase
MNGQPSWERDRRAKRGRVRVAREDVTNPESRSRTHLAWFERSYSRGPGIVPARLAAASADEDSDRARVLDLLRRYGWNATSFQILERGFLYAFDDRAEACVAYVDTGRAWVVAGAPIAREADYAGVVERFVARARASRRRASFFAVEDRFLRSTSLPSLRIGEQPTWDPSEWDDTVRATKSLREQLRRARAKGVTARAIEPAAMEDPSSAVRRAVEALIVRWLASRGMARMGFLVDVQPFAFARERRYVVAERDGSVVAFLAAVPVYARSGWLLEDLLRDPSAPNGTAELVVDFAMRTLAAEGCLYVTLGLAPLAGPVSGWLRLARAWSRALYDFEGVRAFKAKLRPRGWEPIYLAFSGESSGNAALRDALAAFARGSFARFGLETMLQGPAFVVRALAALLLPWTALLASAPTRWFPWSWVKPAWVAFDAAIAVALFALAARWRERLGRALAALVAMDALVTWAEALAWNVPRARGAVDWVVLAVSCAAPTCAAIILSSAVGHHTWMREQAPRLNEQGAPTSAAAAARRRAAP